MTRSFERIKLVVFLIILNQYAHGQYFRGEQVVNNTGFYHANIVLESDSLTIHFLQNDQKKDLAIAYQDIISAKLDVKFGKQLLKYTLLGSLIFFTVAVGTLPTPELVHEPTKIERALWWRSSICITTTTQPIYIRALENRKLLKQLQAKIKHN